MGTSNCRTLKAASKLFLIVNWKIKMVNIWPSMQCCSSLKHTKQKGTIDIFSALKFTVNRCYILVYGTLPTRHDHICTLLIKLFIYYITKIKVLFFIYTANNL